MSQGSPAFLHSLRLNPSLASAFNDAFGGLDGLFGAIFYDLLIPMPQFMEEASAYLHGLRSAHGDATRAVAVGLHIRNGRDFRTKKLTTGEWERVSGCARALVPYSAPASFVVATESAESQTAAIASLGPQVSAAECC